MTLVKCKALQQTPDEQLINVCCVDVKRQKGGLWKKLGFPVCLHYSLINRTSHWILVSVFSCKLAILIRVDCVYVSELVDVRGQEKVPAKRSLS